MKYSEDDIRFIKLKNGDDLVAYVKELPDNKTEIARPIQMIFEVIDEVDDQQILSMKEWLPPLVVQSDSVVIDSSEIMFTTKLKRAFLDHFINLSGLIFDYDTMAELNREKKKLLQESADKTVVSFEDIMKGIKKH